MPDLSLDEIDRRLTADLEFFNRHAHICVKTKTGTLVPFEFNLAQRYIHARLEEQKCQKGYVRACLLKGRQMGGSTYLNDRNYHTMVRRPGVTALVISHESKATDHLLGMVRTFYVNMDPAMKPVLGKDNPRQLTFPALNADYSAVTARNEDAGRSFTAQLVHWSEVAFCERAVEIQESGLQAIGLLPGTEIVMESTANGPAGLFHDKFMAALRGEGDYIAIFTPWFWETSYEREDDGSALTEEEVKFAEMYFAKPFPFSKAPITKALIRRKLLWRRATTFDLSPLNPDVGAAKFRAIYPSNPVEAFLFTGVGEIRGSMIVRARANDLKLEFDPACSRIGGCDPAGAGKKADRTVFAIRQGRVLEKVIKFARLTPSELIGRAVRIMNGERLDKLFVDNGYGFFLVDALVNLKYQRQVMGLWFNESADNPQKYANKRSEILLTAADWVNGGMVSMPDCREREVVQGTEWVCGGDEIHADFACLPIHKEDPNNVHSIIGKDQIIKLLGRSPDILDAFALTFSYPVRRLLDENRWRNKNDISGTQGLQGRKGQGPLSSRRRGA